MNSSGRIWVHRVSFTLIIMSAIAPFHSALAQIPPPAGEPFVESSGTLSVARYSVEGVFGGIEDINKWSPPLGFFIVGVKLKKGSADSIALVLLDDGSVVKLQVEWTYEGSFRVPKRITDRGEVAGPSSNSSADYEKLVGDALYMLSTSGLSVSRNNGSSWQTDTSGLNSANVSDIDLDSAQYVYAATDNGIYVQAPDSNIWRRITSNAFGAYPNFSKIFADRQNRLWLAASTGGIYKSRGKDSTWSVYTSGMGYQVINAFGDDAYGNVYAATTNTSTTSNTIFKSAGGNSPWVRIDQGITSITVRPPTINSVNGDSTLYAATSFGLYVSTDQGSTWKESNSGIPAATFNGFARTQNGRLIASTALALFTKDITDTSWTKRFPANGYESNLSLYQDGSGNLYSVEPVANAFGKLVKSTDGGTTWAYDTAGLSGIGKGIFYIDEHNTQYISTTFVSGHAYKAVVYWRPSGGSWTMDTSGALAITVSGNAIASDRRGYLYMSGYFGNPVGSQTQGVLRKPLTSGVWALDTAGLPAGFTFFYQMAADKNGTMYGHDYYFLLRRTNTGWVSVPGPGQIPGTYYTAFSFDSSNTLVAALEEYSYTTGRSLGRGVYYTTNAGASWTYAGLDSLAVKQLISYGDTTYAITDRGIFVVGRSGATAVQNHSTNPRSFSLFQNYPNPFNPTTTIQFSTSKLSIVNLKVFDLLGREVTTLANGEFAAGMHEVSFDASKFASGIYFYRIQAGSFTATKKLVLLK
jgi:hypothetical protein